MDWPVLTPVLGAIAALFTALGVFGKIIWERASGEGHDERRATDVEIQSAAAVGQIKLLANEFSEYKERAGREIAKLEGKFEILDRMQQGTVQAINGMREEFRNELRDIRTTITRVLEAH